MVSRRGKSLKQGAPPVNAALRRATGRPFSSNAWCLAIPPLEATHNGGTPALPAAACSHDAHGARTQRPEGHASAPTTPAHCWRLRQRIVGPCFMDPPRLGHGTYRARCCRSWNRRDVLPRGCCRHRSVRASPHRRSCSRFTPQARVSARHLWGVLTSAPANVKGSRRLSPSPARRRGRCTRRPSRACEVLAHPEGRVCPAPARRLGSYLR